MNLHSFQAITSNEVRVVRQNPIVVILLVGMPLVVIAVLRTTMGEVLRASGVNGANGSELVVPGQALMFGFFMVSFVVQSFFREHGWFTWDRLRTSTATRADILVGKSLPWLAVSVLQVLVVIGLGIALFGLPAPSLSGAIAVILTALAWTAFIGGFSLMLASVSSSMPAVSAVTNLGAIFFAAVGGALVPIDQLPGWAQAIAPIIPTYWAMQAFDAVFLDHGGVGAALGPIAVVAAFGLAFGVFSWFRFDFDAPKRSWI